MSGLYIIELLGGGIKGFGDGEGSQRGKKENKAGYTAIQSRTVGQEQ